jgi:hypothetical protein
MNDTLLKNNFLYVPQFICPESAEILALKFKEDSENENLPGDGQAWNSGTCYNYTPALEILCDKTPQISDLVDHTVIPTYTYGRVYRKGSVLEKHTDRPACEISATVHLGGDIPWSIWVEDPNRKNRCISLNPGDALIYLGCIAPHWRDEYHGEWYSQIFLHYVRSGGPCSDCYFDKYKPTDGEKNKMIELLFDESEGRISFPDDLHSKPLVLSPIDISGIQESYKEQEIHNKNKSKNNHGANEMINLETEQRTEVLEQKMESKLESIIKSIAESKKEKIVEKPVDSVFIRYEEETPNNKDLRTKKLEDFILVLDDIIPSNLCDDVLNEYKDTDYWDHAMTGGGLDKNARNCSVISISQRELIEQNRDFRMDIDKALYDCVAIALSEYQQKHPEFELEIQEDTGYELLRYKTGEYYVQHSDHFKSQPRTLSCTLCLNEDYGGGEFAFFNRELKYKLKKGSILMFPSNFMYPHEVMPVTSGTRYSIITWLV